MTSNTIADLLVLSVTVIGMGLLFQRRLQRSHVWRATVTPLASIIGSGFLVLAPLLVREFGSNAVVVMAGLCALAYVVGAAIRWNILSIDQSGGISALPLWPQRLDHLSSWTLAFAYVISVGYYLNLFGAFAVSMTDWHSAWHGRIVTSVMLIFVAGLGWSGGFRRLEQAESMTVALKLAVIAGMLAGLLLYVGLGHAAVAHSSNFNWAAVPLAFGMVITVQGFETSRYLSEGFDAATRIRTMRYAQWLSSAIYLAYIGMAGILFHSGSISLRETAVIQMMAPVASVLPLLLVVVALAAQFSAAVADSNGCGGLAQELSRGRVRSRMAYVVIVLIALALTWAVDIYHIISYASRAFSVYYALQCLLAAMLARRAGADVRAIGFASLALLMLAAAILGIPAS